MIYEEIVGEFATIIKRTDAYGKEWFIPKDESNSDYQAYLRWLENPEVDEAQSLQIVLNNRKGVVTNGDHQQNPLQRRGDN